LAAAVLAMTDELDVANLTHVYTKLGLT